MDEKTKEKMKKIREKAAEKERERERERAQQRERETNEIKSRAKSFVEFVVEYLEKNDKTEIHFETKPGFFTSKFVPGHGDTDVAGRFLKIVEETDKAHLDELDRSIKWAFEQQGMTFQMIGTINGLCIRKYAIKI